MIVLVWNKSRKSPRACLRWGARAQWCMLVPYHAPCKCRGRTPRVCPWTPRARLCGWESYSAFLYECIMLPCWNILYTDHGWTAGDGEQNRHCRWKDSWKRDMESVRLKEEDVLDRTKWKNDIQYHSGDHRKPRWWEQPEETKKMDGLPITKLCRLYTTTYHVLCGCLDPDSTTKPGRCLYCRRRRHYYYDTSCDYCQSPCTIPRHGTLHNSAGRSINLSFNDPTLMYS